MNLQVAISTLNDGIYNIKYRSDFDYIVIHQVVNDKDYNGYVSGLPSNVKYIRSGDVGLSKSRNLAIESCTAQYLWLMDDDVVIYERSIVHIKQIISRYSAYALIVVGHSHEKERDLSCSFKIKSLNTISAASISSIDMILNLKEISNVVFDVRFGLGAEFPSGEEYIYACDLLRQGSKIIKTDFVCSYHPLIASGLDFYSTNEKLEAKVRMFQRAVGNISGRFCYFLFILKKIKVVVKNKVLVRSLSYIIK